MSGKKQTSFFSLPVLSLLFTVFIDSLGFGLVFPLLSPLLMENGGIFASDLSFSTRGLIFGSLASIYCLGQFFGSPFLGRLSDCRGRKKVLIGTLWLACFAYLLGSLAIVYKSIVLLFVSRLLCGISAGNYPVAQSMIVDMVPPENRVRGFGLINMAWGTGFILGPFLGGRFSVFGFSTPFLFAALVCLITALLALWKLKETFASKEMLKFNMWEGITNIKKGFKNPFLKGLFYSLFIYSIGWGFFTEYSSLFLLKRLSFDVESIANFYAYAGLWIALSQGVLIRPFAKRFSPQILLRGAFVLLALSFPLMLYCKNFYHIMWVLPLISFSESIVGPASSVLVSSLASKENQGEMLGISQSIKSAGVGLAPLFSGSLVALHLHLPITIPAICTVLSLILFLKFFKSPNPVPLQE